MANRLFFVFYKSGIPRYTEKANYEARIFITPRGILYE